MAGGAVALALGAAVAARGLEPAPRTRAGHRGGHRGRPGRRRRAVRGPCGADVAGGAGGLAVRRRLGGVRAGLRRHARRRAAARRPERRLSAGARVGAGARARGQRGPARRGDVGAGRWRASRSWRPASLLVRGLRRPDDPRVVALALACGACIAGYTIVDCARHRARRGAAVSLARDGAHDRRLRAAGRAHARHARRCAAAFRPATCWPAVLFFAAYLLVLAALRLAEPGPVAAVRETSVRDRRRPRARSSCTSAVTARPRGRRARSSLARRAAADRAGAAGTPRPHAVPFRPARAYRRRAHAGPTSASRSRPTTTPPPSGSCAALGVSHVTAQVLVRRGLGDAEAARAFLAADVRHPLDAFGGLREAAARILAPRRARRRGSPCTATTTSTASAPRPCSCARCGRSAPTSTGTCRAGSTTATGSRSRRSSGSPRAAPTCWSRSTARSRPSTRSPPRAPPGSTSWSRTTTRRGPTARLPDAPIVHPAVGGYPCPELCAAGVAHMLARALLEAAGDGPAAADADLDLVALATVADCRAARGREPAAGARRACGRSPRRASPGLQALMEVARVDPSGVDAGAIGFRLAPRINAAGRLHRADAGLELLLTADVERARAVAAELDAVNTERRDVETRILFEAEAQVAESAPRRAGLRARRRRLASGRDRDRRVADRRAPSSPGRADRARRRARERARAARSRRSTCSAGWRPPARTCCATAAIAPRPG